jgi:protein-S-isoprenylcysteine O-methyltransferase
LNTSLASVFGLVFLVSESGLAIFKRAGRHGQRAADQGSLRLLWTVIALSVFLAYVAAGSLPAAKFGPAPLNPLLGAAIFLVGLAIRWYAIVYLGRFFTVNVAIAADHRLIDSGPYRFIRHPSYAGALMAFLGLGLTIGNWVSLALLLAPTLMVFQRRMDVEESALIQAFGTRYQDYMRRTKRLLPGIY